MKSHEKKLILFGLYTLVVSAILGIVAVLLAGTLPGPEQTSAWADDLVCMAMGELNSFKQQQVLRSIRPHI